METTSKQPNMNLMEEDNKITIVPYKKKYLQITLKKFHLCFISMAIHPKIQI